MAVGHRDSNWDSIFQVPNEKERNIIYRTSKDYLHRSLQKKIPFVPKVLSKLLPGQNLFVH